LMILPLSRFAVPHTAPRTEAIRAFHSNTTMVHGAVIRLDCNRVDLHETGAYIRLITRRSHNTQAHHAHRHHCATARWRVVHAVPAVRQEPLRAAAPRTRPRLPHSCAVIRIGCAHYEHPTDSPAARSSSAAVVQPRLRYDAHLPSSQAAPAHRRMSHATHSLHASATHSERHVERARDDAALRCASLEQHLRSTDHATHTFTIARLQLLGALLWRSGAVDSRRVGHTHRQHLRVRCEHVKRSVSKQPTMLLRSDLFALASSRDT
jgi:hypothetical protein